MKATWQTAVCSLVLAGAFAAPAMASDFDAWDTDKSGGLSYQEWDAGFDEESLVKKWDDNGDNFISDKEFGENIYRAYDADESGDWKDDEYRTFERDSLQANGLYRT
ncbi:hypothetical protein [Stutzerimonas urumqiensis]|uniref:hypothetical protein n=1 Tax=Stutzerimonas urumqiensis TaxID=638269 RepID=UPI000EB0B7B4|nr:hypothetical protein [Stutzerimonas urumqiensis]